MRGDTPSQSTMLSLTTTDDFIPEDHPIRRIKPIVERALTQLSPVFTQMYSKRGRPSIPPEHLLKGSLLIALYSIRSERQFCERLRYDLLFKWFLGLNIEDKAFDASTFSKNKDRLLEHDVAGRFFKAVLSEAKRKHLLSPDHFTVDGTLLESWASIKSFKPRDGNGPPSGEGRNPDANFHGERRSNATHISTTDPEARLARKGPGKEAKLSFGGHVLMENRNGLVVDLALTQATGTAERQAALMMLGRLPRRRRITIGADKGYDTKDFVAGCRKRSVSPHVARKRKHSAIDGRTVRHSGYVVSQRVRKRVEEIFGWMKTVGGGRKLRYVGVERNHLWATLTTAAYNLVRMAKLIPASG
ncbi:MAG: IS5 family transposase [Chloroflexi bacterium]|nr:IS5 family transposase [Chloroflexota bacterium]